MATRDERLDRKVKVYGHGERRVPLVDVFGTDRTAALEQEFPTGSVEGDEYVIPAEREVITEDITAELDEDAARAGLAASDVRMARIGEDLIQILLSKGVITEDDFTPEARDVLNNRASARGRLR